jgi:hypothetical protein
VLKNLKSQKTSTSWGIENVFVFALCRPVAVRTPGLPQQMARMTLTYAMLTRHGSPHCAVAQGLEVSLRDVLQHQVIQAQVRHQPLQLPVLLLQLLQPLRLVDP